MYLERIEPYADTFSRLSHCLMQASVLRDVLQTMQTFHASYTRTCARRFLSHYMIHHYPDDVVGMREGEPDGPAQRVRQSATDLFRSHREGVGPAAFVEAFDGFTACFAEWQQFDKAKLACTYRDVYRLLQEIHGSSPVEIQAPVDRLRRTIDGQTTQIFGADAPAMRRNLPPVESDGREHLEQFVHQSCHDLYWQEVAQQLECNSFDALCSVIDHVKARMLALCATQRKRDEVEAFLDVGFLHNVLHVGMAQTQVKSLLSYCLRFLQEYGQPCHDTAIAGLLAKTASLYTTDAPPPIPTMVDLIREIAQRIDDLAAVVCALSTDVSTT